MKIILYIFYFLPLITYSQLIAFPYADGFGKYTSGGNGGTIIHVTNLNDNGAGSFREAIKTNGVRIVVFDVGGTINATTLLEIGAVDNAQNIAKENITIMGETAPFPGITITGKGIDILTSNVIIRYLTVRRGSLGEEDGIRIKNWGVNGYKVSNVIIDHCTISHASDENFSISGANSVSDVRDVTFSNNMLGHPYTGYNSLLATYVYNYSYIGNFFHEANDRNPYIGYGLNNEKGEFINNISYSNAGSLVVYGNFYDVIGNIYKGFNGNDVIYEMINNAANSFNNPTGTKEDGHFHYDGNIGINLSSNSDGLYDPRALESNLLTRANPDSYITTWETTQLGIEDRVFNQGTGVGNSVYRETLDQSAIDRYYADTGNYSIPNIPVKSSTSRSVTFDTDLDGIDDDWEITHYGDLTKTAIGYDDINFYQTKIGRPLNTYTNIQKYSFFLTNEIRLLTNQPLRKKSKRRNNF